MNIVRISTSRKTFLKNIQIYEINREGGFLANNFIINKN